MPSGMICCLLNTCSFLLLVTATTGGATPSFSAASSSSVNGSRATASTIIVSASKKKPSRSSSSVDDDDDARKNGSFILSEWERVSNFSIVYNKIQKCSSSTVGGVFRTIGLHRNAHPDTGTPFFLHHLSGGKISKLADSEVAELLHEPFVMAMHESAKEWRHLRPRVRCFAFFFSFSFVVLFVFIVFVVVVCVVVL